MKKTIVVLLMLAVVIGFCFANGAQEASKAAAPAAETKESHIPEGTPPQSKYHLTFWTDMSGDSLICTQDAASAFNASQDLYEMEVIYTGSILAKLLTSTPADRPNLFHSSANNSSRYISMEGESRLYVPIQEFITHDNFDMSNVVKNLATNYTRNGEWQCAPWGNTAVGYFFNTDILSAHGIDVESLKSYQEILEACRKLKAEGVEHPFFYRIHADYINFALTAEGVDYFNKANGKEGVPTACLFNEGRCYEATLEFFRVLKQMAEEDLLVDIQVGNTDARNMFGQGDIAIMGGYASGIDPTFKVTREDVHFVFRPSPTVFKGTETHGQAPGGACIFLADVDDPWKEYGSWLFLKFFMQDEWTSKFAMASGYVPITMTGAQTPEYQEYVKTKNPSATAIMEAQNNTPVGVTFALLPYSTNYNTVFKNIFTKMVSTPDYSAEQATEDLYKETTDAIEMYFLEQGIVI